VHFMTKSNQDNNLNLLIEQNIGMLEFYTQNISKSKQYFLKLLEEKNKKESRAFSLFFMGQIDLEEGNNEEGIKKLQECIDINKKYFIAKEAKKLIESNK